MTTASRIEYFGIEKKELHDELDYHLENLEMKGFTVIEDVLSESLCTDLASRMDTLNEAQNKKFGVVRLKELKDYGVIRDMLCEDEAFLQLVIHPMVLAIVERTIGSTAILHLQNGIVLEPHTKHDQAAFHRDFSKDFVCEKVLAMNTMFVIDEFSPATGGTWIVPFTHKNRVVPSDRYMEENGIQITAKRGSLFVFDGLLVHKAGDNKSPNYRRAINHQYTRPFIKQQLDYVGLMEGRIEIESKLGQVMGFWTRPPKSVEEYRVDPDKRTYRKGQG
jgi:ectoine hydroxylase-related dioxygenase (phytanoyl-CoA dioxygenase family)